MASSSISIQKEDRLEGSSNFVVWKMRMMNILQELDLVHFVTSEPNERITEEEKIAFKRRQARAKRIIFDLVKDSVMTIMTSLMSPKQCMNALTQLYEKSATTQKRFLKHQLKYLKMEKGDSVGAFCSKIAQIRE